MKIFRRIFARRKIPEYFAYSLIGIVVAVTFIFGLACRLSNPGEFRYPICISMIDYISQFGLSLGSLIFLTFVLIMLAAVILNYAKRKKKSTK